MKRTADVIVIGAGVIGSSIAYHLSRLGAGNVCLLERHTIGSGASSRSGALIRTHYTNTPEAQLALASLPWFREWDERVGGHCGFQQTGFIQLVHPTDHAKLKKHVANLQSIGVHTEIMSAKELRDLQPQLQVDDDTIVAYEPYSGYADPIATTRGFANAAKRRGVTILEDCEVTSLLSHGGRVTGVTTPQGDIQAATVVIANGGWSVPLLKREGLELPIRMVRVQIASYARPSVFARGAAAHLTLIDRANGIYCRPDGDNATLVGVSSHRTWIDHPDEYDPDNEPTFVDLARQYASRRIPTLNDQPYLRGHAGVLDVTTDTKAILDHAPGLEGAYLAVGMSGSGFKKAPAIGACMAELVMNGKASTAPIDAFRYGRFLAEQERNPERDDNYTLPEELKSKDVVGYLN